MDLLYMVSLMVVAVRAGEEQYHKKFPLGHTLEPNNKYDLLDYELANTELLMSFVVFRHGDRTPDEEELKKFPTDTINYDKIFFPYGKKALTNKGKQRGYLVGEYLRERYDNLISKLYLPDEISVRTTDFSRTKMTALTALSAIYPPPPAQKWNPFLNWQPVPYDTLAYDDDDLLYYYNCPRYLELRQQVYNLPEVQKKLKPYEGLFKFLTIKTGTDISVPEDVFYLDNLFQTLANIGVRAPKWANDVMPQIKEMTKIEYALEYHTSEMIRLASGVLLADALNATNAAIEGKWDQPKLRLYSAHENNVAGFMAAMKVFKPHQPKYGSTISLELRKRILTGQYGFTATYAADGGGPGVVLPIAGCGGQAFCDYDTFVTLTQDHVISRSDHKKVCSTPIS
ncbi:prostatic acid phosphatase-like [Vanessa atalanta]|uniref:prostatic acid phosphatase-like n=1 Tax=Vanessa atalanta TaxID=42275 RepID=UPI001FCD0603|nr:prostatic acid phosphatase-like [Vanessa atalanta]